MNHGACCSNELLDATVTHGDDLVVCILDLLIVLDQVQCLAFNHLTFAKQVDKDVWQSCARLELLRLDPDVKLASCVVFQLKRYLLLFCSISVLYSATI